jgi:hypothetical protein
MTTLLLFVIAVVLFAIYFQKVRRPLTAHEKRVNQAFALFVGVPLVLFILVALAAAEPQQTRVYDTRGNSVGTIVPQGQGSVRYYDARGNSLGTSTTNSTGTTTFYGPRGNVTGTTVAPHGAGRGR